MCGCTRAGRPRNTCTSYIWPAAAHKPQKAQVRVSEDGSNGCSRQQLHTARVQGKHRNMQTLFAEEVENLIATEAQA